MSAIDIPSQGQITYNYDPAEWNNPVKMTVPGGSSTYYIYDSVRRLESITAKDPGGNPVISRNYQYSALNNITSKNTEHGEYTYEYDELSRVTQAINPTLEDESYTYDAMGNRLTSASTTGDWTYNANNELQGFDDTSFQYDDNGNTTQKVKGTDEANYIYDVEDRLIQVKDGSNNEIAKYYYDPFGRRLWKDVGGARTYYGYSGEGLIGEYDTTGTVVKSYGYVPDSTWGTDPLFQKVSNAYYWYQNDHSGTPQKLIATNGLVVWSATYDTFGNCNVDIEGIENNFRFPGQYYDEETGLYYNYYRYYDPGTGRYLRADPFGDGLNLYIYCYNNPTGLVDPLGLCALKDPHNWLAALGLIPALGIVPDLLDALLYLIEGEYGMAIAAGIAAIPLVGYLPRIIQYGGKFLKPLLKKVGDYCVPLLGRGLNYLKENAGALIAKYERKAPTSPASNSALHEAYKRDLRAQMGKPNVTDSKLSNMMNHLYRDDATIGSGSTADIIRAEKLSGPIKGDTLHVQKGRDAIVNLEKWLKNNPKASPGDTAAAENVIADLKDALSY